MVSISNGTTKENMTTSDNNITQKVWRLLEQVTDPEVPVLSVTDLGIVRDVKLYATSFLGDVGIDVIITPTYSGCPAMKTIEWDIKTMLLQNGYTNVKITTILSPSWTTDWMTESGKQKLKAYGIAPPNPTQIVCNTKLFAAEEVIQCPKCDSFNTRLISQFGSTACKALYQCKDCQEPFEYFKCH
jgi:ring-1,2-phenylacetyl-CoA epoxidase subunit PaaD